MTRISLALSARDTRLVHRTMCSFAPHVGGIFIAVPIGKVCRHNNRGNSTT